jgi:hypothetical protein
MSAYLERDINHALYPGQAIAEARQAFREHCEVQVVPLGSTRARIRLKVRPQHADNAREIFLSFLNFALDRSAQIHFDQS